MKKNLMTVLILALMIVNIVLTTITMFSVTSTNSKTAELVSNIATVLDLELTTPSGELVTPAVSLADTAVYDLGSMTMLLGDGAYLVCNVSLSQNTKHNDYKAYGGDEKMAANATLIKDAVSTVVSGYTKEDCLNNMEGLKADILKAVHQLFQSDFVYQVAISEVKVN
ncbi:MAG: flagellar basal body-associated protein FliL [Acetatifactor sp.]|nr:flagellar basal body-associated protein FliL [Acetatifactor sp.]